MDLDKYIRPDGSTYYATGPADPADKLFVDPLPGVDVFPRKKNIGLILLAAILYFIYKK